LGASAGGLEALEKFFSLVPTSSGLAFVVVQHLAPDHASVLAEILTRHTRLSVVEAESGTRLQGDHVYVIAPGTLLTIEKGVLHVAESAHSTASAPVDTCFRSLAEDRGEYAIGVLLSGSGHDGTDGLRAIRGEGGLTLAQSPDTARFGEMPGNAIEARLVDHVLQVEEMPGKILEHLDHLARVEAPSSEGLDSQLTRNIGRICALVQQRTGHDFSRYKQGTLLRRIRRRLQVQHVGSVDQYLQLLEHQAGEAEGLLDDFLIGVTQFFRDPEAFQALAQLVVPQIAKPRDGPVRIWVPGCASGEEAYSIAILVHEHLERMEARPLVQIFATDLDAAVIAEARDGRYGTSIAEQVSPERLERFFVREGQAYRAVKALRETCIFSVHSIVRDPPFSRLDLVSCRNLLIYLSADLQQKLVPIFHYALRPGGFLFLGSSEGIAGNPDLFEIIDKSHRVFRRKEPVTRPVVEFPFSGRGSPQPSLPAAGRWPSREAAPPPFREKIGGAFERTVLEEYAHPSAIVNERGDALFVAGPIGRYLQLPAGATSVPNLLEAFRGSLGLELRTALRAASAHRSKVVREGVPVEIAEVTRRVRLIVRPAPRIEPEAGLFLVVLQEGVPLEEAEQVEAAQQPVEQSIVEHLEDDLRRARAELESMAEEFDSTNEEFKSANEELISTNEELQSANEELQSSREELQSLNEELETVNAELRNRVDELDTTNSDLKNLFASTEIATIFLDRKLQVSRFTPAATELLHLIEADVGRFIGDLAPRFEGHDLVADAQEVLRTLKPLERQVHADDGEKWFVLRAIPYRTLDNIIDGVVITLVDVSKLKRAEQGVERARQGLSRLAEASLRVVQETDLEGMLQAVSEAALALTGARNATCGHGYFRGRFVVGGSARAPGAPSCPPGDMFLMEKGGVHMDLVEGADAIRLTDAEVRAHPRWWGLPEKHVPLRGLLGVRLVARDGRTNGMLLVTDKEQDDFTTEDESLLRQLATIASLGLQHVEARIALEQRDRHKNHFIAMLSHELRNPLTPIRNSLYILDRAVPGGEQAKRAHEVIGRQSAHLTRLVDDLLDTTRVASGKIQLRRELLDLGDVVRRAVEDHRTTFVRGGVALEVNVPGKTVWIQGDRTRVAQIVSNLVQNAAKFTERGGTTVVSVEESARLCQAIVRVRDTGIGIAPEMLSRLFEPFSQADTTLARSQGGLGLGLALVKGLVDMHGGMVSAESEGPGNGAEFIVRFRLETAEIPLPASRRCVAASTGGPRRVLLIEDNVDAADTLREVLGFGEHAVDVAHSGAEGLAKARAFHPDVVLCDIGLPGMDGYEVARVMRADPELQGTRLVALTGYAGSEAIARAKEAGFDIHLRKPPSLEDIEGILALCEGRETGQD
jgi:two-component system CheB/CheR fusion protein